MLQQRGWAGALANAVSMALSKLGCGLAQGAAVTWQPLILRPGPALDLPV